MSMHTCVSKRNVGDGNIQKNKELNIDNNSYNLQDPLPSRYSGATYFNSLPPCRLCCPLIKFHDPFIFYYTLRLLFAK